MALNKWKAWLRRSATVSTATFVLAGCSSSLFTGDKGSELNNVGSGGDNTGACAGLNLSQSQLDVPTARALVHCLNANGSINEYEALVKKTTDAQLQQLLDLLNTEVISNPTRLRQLSQTFDQLGNDNGVLDQALSKVSILLSKGKFVRAAINLAKQGTHTGANGEIDPAVLTTIHLLSDELQDHKAGKDGILAARANLDRIFSSGIAATSLKSYNAIMAGLKSSIKPLPGDTLPGLATLAHQYLKAKISENQVYGKLLAWGIADGTLFDTFDHFYNNECEDSFSCTRGTLTADDQIAATTAFLRMLTVESQNGVSNREAFLKPMTDLFHVFDAEVACMDGTKKIPNGDMYVMSELMGGSVDGPASPLDVPQWLMRTNTIKMKLASSLCKFPSFTDGQSTETFNQLATVLRNLAQYRDADGSFGRPMITVTHLLAALQTGDGFALSPEARADLAPYFTGYAENERLRRFLVHWLGDTSSINSYKYLTDSLAELARGERGVLANALYFLNSPQPNSPDGTRPTLSRDDLKKVAKILMTVRPEFASSSSVPGSNPASGRSLYDVAMNAMLNVDTGTLIDILNGASDFIDMADLFAQPLLRNSREALLGNDVTPVLELALDVAHDAQNRKKLFQTLFDIADTTEFENAMALTSKMAGNGDLKRLFKSMFTMFKATIDRGAGNATPLTPAPVRLVDADHDRSVADAPAWRPAPAFWPKYPERMAACAELNLDLPFGDSIGSGAAAWSDQMNKLAACVDANGDNTPVADLIRYGNTAMVSSGQSFFAKLVSLIGDIVPDSADADLRAIYDEAGNLLVDAKNFADLTLMNNVLPLMIGKKYCTAFNADENDSNPRYSCPSGTEEISVMQSLGRMASRVSKLGSDIQGLNIVGAAAVVEPQALRAGYYLYDSYWAADDVSTPVRADARPSQIVSYPMHAIDTDSQNSIVAAKIDELYKKYHGRAASQAEHENLAWQYFNQPLSGDQRFYTDYAGRTRTGYKDAADFKKSIKPVLDELSQDNRIEWLMTYMLTFDNNPYSPEWWADWFTRLSSEVRPIPYYYPGTHPEKKTPPTVRFVSQLDLLEMVVVDADFCLNDVGMGWGAALAGFPADANRSIYYLSQLANAGDHMTPVIDAMYAEVKKFSSFPFSIATSDEVKRRLFNLQQDLQVLRDADVVRPWKRNDGTTVYLSDLAVLRDVFQNILQATQPQNKGSYAREKNSLAFITALVGSGVMRVGGANTWHLDENGHFAATDLVPTLRFLFESTFVKGRNSRLINQGTLNIFNHLVRDDCDKTKPAYRNGCNKVPRSSWTTESFNDRYQFVGQLIDTWFEWIKDDDRLEDQGQTRIATLLKRDAFDLVHLIDRFGFRTDGSRDSVTPGLVPVALQQILATKKGTDYLAKNYDALEPIIKDTKAVHLLEMLLDGESSSPRNFDAVRSMMPATIAAAAANNGAVGDNALNLIMALKGSTEWEGLKSTFKWLRRDAEYKQMKRDYLGRIGDQVETWALREDTKLRPRLQTYLGNHMLNGDLRDLLVFMGNESKMPDERLYNQIKFIGDYDQGTQSYPWINKLNDFMDMMHRGLVENGGSTPAPSASRPSLLRALINLH